MFPKFRADLEVSQYDEGEGKISIVLKDPIADKFFRLSVYEYLFLKAFDGTKSLDAALQELKAEGHFYSLEDARLILDSASRMGLLLGTPFSSSEKQLFIKKYMDNAQRMKHFASVYFLFIPLLNPDKFLEKTLWIFKLFFNKWVAIFIALLIPGAIYFVIDGLDVLEREFLFFFNLENIIYLWITIVITKLVHEFSHAYVAKQFGRYVPEMGVALLILFPCLYCNTTDAWQLSDRKQRMAIGAAGILAEAVLAVFAIYIWHYTKPGIINSLAFYLFNVSLISTLIFNANPLIRFDGYYILIDAIRTPNLVTKSRQYLRHIVMDKLLGLAQVQNNARTLREKLIFGIYGTTSTMYRVALYAFIIVGVYTRFDKVLGIVLASWAIVTFVLMPMKNGVSGMYARRGQIKPKFAGFALLTAILVAALAALCLPLSAKSLYPCYMASSKTQKLTIPLMTMVDRVLIREGSVVKEGDLLYTLDTNELELNLFKKDTESEISKKKMEILLVDEKYKSRAVQKALDSYIQKEEANLTRVDLELAKNGIRAPFDGIISKLDLSVQKGLRTEKGFVVGQIDSNKDRVVYGLILEDELYKFHKGQSVQVWFPIGTGLVLDGTIESIRMYSQRELDDSPFSSRFGGEVATERRALEQHGKRNGSSRKNADSREVPLTAIYVCTVDLAGKGTEVPLGITGRLVVPYQARSLLSRAVDELVKTLNKEAFF